MGNWIGKGLKTGIVTTKYPDIMDNNPGVTPGFPVIKNEDINIADSCPAGAIDKNGSSVNKEKCIHCFRCATKNAKTVSFDNSFQWAKIRDKSCIVPDKFKHSMFIRVIDVGDCGVCMNEIKLLNNPYYNIHRLGFFITPTPRKADILIVAGTVSEHMKVPLLNTYEAMPSPKRVISVGVCSLNCGIYRKSFFSNTKVSDVIPVDVEIPGCPPPPLALIHGLLVISGRKNAEKIIHSDTNENRGIL